MQVCFPYLPTWGIQNQAACGHLGKEWGMNMTPHLVEVPARPLALMGHLCRQLLLRGSARLPHAPEFEEWGLGENGV